MANEERPRELFFCDRCARMRPHKHMHDTAHGLEQTHMQGSERFVCVGCGRTTYANDTGAERFPFILDKVSK